MAQSLVSAFQSPSERAAIDRLCAWLEITDAETIAAQDHVKEIKHPTPIGQAQHCPDLNSRCFARPVADRLIQQRRCIAHGPFSGAGDQGQSIVGNFGPFVWFMPPAANPKASVNSRLTISPTPIDIV